MHVSQKFVNVIFCETTWENFTKFTITILLHLGTNMNWLDLKSKGQLPDQVWSENAESCILMVPHRVLCILVRSQHTFLRCVFSCSMQFFLSHGGNESGPFVLWVVVVKFVFKYSILIWFWTAVKFRQKSYYLQCNLSSILFVITLLRLDIKQHCGNWFTSVWFW